MIPINLKLSNFTSYGENPPDLDFNRFKLAAISGLNGAGKSSLLDAITWCVWGTSRAGDSADNLVHLGAESMQVEFTFQLDGAQYTIKRRRVKKGGGSTALELWSNSHNLTEGTIKSTQEKIINLLHLTYETFTNSSFLRQGHDNEFTTKGPTDRKRILSEILGLSHYDALEEKAKLKAKDASTKLQLLEYQLLEIETELSQKEEREKSLSLAQEEAKKVESQLSQIEVLIKSIQQEHQTISSTLQSLSEKKSQLEQVKVELSDLDLQILQKEKAKKDFQNILNQKSEIEENYKKLQDLQENKNLLETKRSELIKVKDELAAVQKVLITREEKRQLAIKDIEINIKKFQTENEQIQIQNEHLKTHQDVCPTCNQQIGKQTNEQILKTNQTKLEKNSLEIKNLESTLDKYKSIVLPEEKQMKILEEKIKSLEEQTKDWATLNQQIQTLDNYSTLFINLQQAETGIKTLEESVLDLQKIYSQKQKQIEASEKELKETLIFEEKLQKIQLELSAKEAIKIALSQRALEIHGQVGEAKQLVSRSQQLEKFALQKQTEKTTLQQEKDIFEELALAFGKRGIQAMIIEAAIPEIEDNANTLLSRLTEGRMKVRLETQKETKTKVAGGERGLIETLDIIISDEMGERPYELYSGGEAFRVNFSIRLAISQLLTHRAGAKLQFLVVDEGFGSQDAPGRARLVEVIDIIKDQFEKILVITHLEELKEEFPTRIEVSKNSNGSTFEVVGV